MPLSPGTRTKNAALVLSLLVAACSSNADKDQTSYVEGETLTWPTTVDEAVTELETRWFTEEQLSWIKSTPKNYVVSHLHFPFGNQVRQSFGLWGENVELLESCGDDFAEACSDIIFAALWESVQENAPGDKE